MFQSLKTKLKGKSGGEENKEKNKPRLTSPAETLQLFPVEEGARKKGKRRGHRKQKRPEDNPHYHQCLLRAERNRPSVEPEVRAFVLTVIEDARVKTEKELHAAAVQRYVERVIATADNNVKPGRHGYLQKLKSFKPLRSGKAEQSSKATRKSTLDKRPPKALRKVKKRLKRRMTADRRKCADVI